MNNKVFLILVLLGWLYIWASKEKFSNFQQFCNKYTTPKNIDKPKKPTKDIYGFPKTKKEQKKEQSIKLQVTYCPMRLDFNNTVKLIKASEMQYIIDVRDKVEFDKSNIVNTINCPNLYKTTRSLHLLNNLGKTDNILVIANTPYNSFRAGKNLKKIGGFTNVFYMQNGNYKMLKNKLSKSPMKNQILCNNTWGHPMLCNPSLTNHF